MRIPIFPESVVREPSRPVEVERVVTRTQIHTGDSANGHGYPRLRHLSLVRIVAPKGLIHLFLIPSERKLVLIHSKVGNCLGRVANCTTDGTAY